jgi:hypothetical protein
MHQRSSHGAASQTSHPLLIVAMGSANVAFDGSALGILYFVLDASVHSHYGFTGAYSGLTIIKSDSVFAFVCNLDKLTMLKRSLTMFSFNVACLFKMDSIKS